MNYLLAHIATFENQLSRYSFVQNDVILYVTNALESDGMWNPSSTPVYMYCMTYCTMS